ncbi:hypothetical protein ACMAZF_03955 [Psychrobium sp. nBUS_13]
MQYSDGRLATLNGDDASEFIAKLNEETAGEDLTFIDELPDEIDDVCCG